MDKPLNVLLIDYSEKKKSTIYQILSESGFNTVFISYDEIEKISAMTPQCDIILFRIIDAFLKYNNIITNLKKITEKGKIPIVILSSVRKVNFYIEGLESGFCHYISTPISKEHLIKRLRRIIWLNENLHDNNKFSLNFEYLNTNYSLDLQKDTALKFMISALDNSIHHNKMLVESLRRQTDYKTSLSKLKTKIIPGALTLEERKIEEELWTGIDSSQFKLFYQPVVSISNGIIRGFEALVRWMHPSKGLLNPDSFIPLAEKSPVIIALGFWIVEEAARQVKAWNKKYQLSESLRININLSPKQFIHPELSEKIISIVDKMEISHESLAFEITESAFMEDMESANLMLLKLKNKNFKIYMDDFGTGYSSLTYLLHFPVDSIKIDKSFVQWMHIDEQSEQLVKSLIYLAHSLNMKVVTEGVETIEHLNILEKYGCDYGQGYYYSPPLDAVKAEELIASGKNFYEKIR